MSDAARKLLDALTDNDGDHPPEMVLNRSADAALKIIAAALEREHWLPPPRETDGPLSWSSIAIYSKGWNACLAAIEAHRAESAQRKEKP